MPNLHYEKFADGSVKCIEDEIPFELPEGWAWTRIGNVAIVKGGKRVPKGMTFSSAPTQHAYVRVTDMKNHTVNLSDLKYIDEAVFSEIKNYTIAKNDLYITIAGTIGAVGEFPDELDGMNLTENAVKVTAITLNKTFLCLMMQTEYVQKQFKHKTYQVAMPKLGLERILTTLIPICSTSTQNRICKAVNDASIYIEIISENYQGLSDTITAAKSKILDLAIRGKLVPQNPEDEPASVLLERFRAEKEELIRQGKIKRDKKESIIFKGEDNSYYDEIPENWSITTLNQLTHTLLLNDGDWILSENMNSQGEVKLIQLGSVGMMRYVDKGFKYLTEITFKELNCTQIYPGYMLINRIVSDKMCSCILPQIEGKLITTVDTCWVAPKEEWYSLKYLMYTLSSPTIQSLVMLNSAGTTRKRISKNNLINLPFAFPPLDEQHRIVETIENAFAQLDAISDSLN